MAHLYLEVTDTLLRRAFWGSFTHQDLRILPNQFVQGTIQRPSRPGIAAAIWEGDL